MMRNTPFHSVIRCALSLIAVPFPLIAIMLWSTGDVFAQTTNSDAASGFFGSFAPVLAAKSKPASVFSTQTPSYADLQQRFYQFAVQAGVQDYSEILRLEPGGGKPDLYASIMQAGAVPSGPGLTVSTFKPVTTARSPVPNQLVLHPFIQKEFSEYPNPLENNFGPPHGPVFRHTPPHNPEPTGNVVNPATFKNAPYMTGAPPSDLVSHAIALDAAQRTAEQLLNPSFQSAQAAFAGTVQVAGDAAGGAGSAQFDSNLISTSSALINVANEAAAVPVDSKANQKTIAQAVWMVQQLFKSVFLPMSLLLLLPGAVITQIVGLSKFGVTLNTDEDSVNPFAGILRATIAIFLIPATQMIVSYSIDVGNSLTLPVTQFIDNAAVSQWADTVMNSKVSGTPAQIAKAKETQTTLAATMKVGMSSIDMLLNSALMILVAYQTVMACYLLLMGPIAAALFAWPSGVGQLFRPVFGNWIEGLFNLVLWRFWWCVILCCMSTRIQWLNEIGSFDAAGPWESIVYTAFMVMLAYVPFMALDFKPGDMIDQLMEKTGAGQ